MLLKYYFKNIVYSRRIWIFGIALGLFLLYAGYAQSLAGLKLTRSFDMGYSAQWISIVILFAMGSVSTAVAQSGVFSASSLPYLFRFSRFRRRDYVYNLSVSAAIACLVLSTILSVAGMELFSGKFGTGIMASSISGTYLSILMGSFFMIFFSIFLVLVCINYIGARSLNYIYLVPSILTYGFGIILLTTSALNISLFYAIPFTDFLGIFYAFFTGSALHLYNSAGSSLNIYYMVVSILIWTALLAAADILMLGRLKLVSMEETRQL